MRVLPKQYIYPSLLNVAQKKRHRPGPCSGSGPTLDLWTLPQTAERTVNKRPGKKILNNLRRKVSRFEIPSIFQSAGDNFGHRVCMTVPERDFLQLAYHPQPRSTQSWKSFELITLRLPQRAAPASPSIIEHRGAYKHCRQSYFGGEKDLGLAKVGLPARRRRRGERGRWGFCAFSCERPFHCLLLP